MIHQKHDDNRKLNMKGKLTLLLMMMSTWLVAQESTGGRMTLEQCIDYALANNVNAKNAALDREIANAKVKETVGIGLPQVSGTVTAQQSPTQQRFFTTYYTPDPDEGGISFIDPDVAQEVGIGEGEVVAAENFFQLKGMGDASLSINQLIFNGSYFVGLQAAKTYKDLAVKQASQTKEQVILGVTKAFYNVLITQERLELVESNLKRLDTLFRNTKAMQENGFAEKIDVDRLKVQLNNLKVGKQDLESLNDISMKLLKFQMSYPFQQMLIIDGSLEEAALTNVEVPLDSFNYAKRPDYQVMQVNYELQKLNIKNKYAEAIPTLAAYANLGYSTQSPTFGAIFKTESGFEDTETARGTYGPDKWYGYSSIGLRLSWNLFTGLQRNFQIQQEKLTLEKLENGFESLEQSIDMEIYQSQQNLKNAISKLEVQRESMDLATSIFDITEIKYQEGVGSNLEVVEADNSLKEAQTNYYSALYDAIIAQLELKKALGTLYNEQ
ncbi:MAG: TolC family protein [Marinoscillum sp.]